jgi:hypothetical protein
MKSFFSFAVFLALFCRCVLSAPRETHYLPCVEYKGVDDPDIYEAFGTLKTVVKGRPAGGFYRTGIKKIGDGTEGGRSYTYTIDAGVGAEANSGLYIQVDRKRGKGLGQKFKIDFEYQFMERTASKSYTIWPNEMCVAVNPFAGSLVNNITVNARVE